MLKLLKGAKDRLAAALKRTDSLPESWFGNKELTPEEKANLAHESIKRTQEVNRKIQSMGLGPKKGKLKGYVTHGHRIKIALDESVGTAMAKKLEAKGYSIVCRAGNAEPDAVWLKRALEKGALFIVSPDLDIPSLIEKQNYPMVWIDFLFASSIHPTITNDEVSRDDKRNMWVQYVHDRIQAKLKFLDSTFGDLL